MDENYLDSLLNEVSLDKELDNKIEEELDSQMQQEKKQYQEQQLISDEDLFNMDLDLDAKDMQTQDVHFSEEQMDELDHLDKLADLDIEDLDFSDIDFDDLDVTKLDDVEMDDLDDLLKEFEGDLDIAKLFAPIDSKKDVASDLTPALEDVDGDGNSVLQEEAKLIPEQEADLNEDSFDAEHFLDSLLENTEVSTDNISKNVEDTSENSELKEIPEIEHSDDELDLLQALEEFEGNVQTQESVNKLSDGELDDLLSMLDLDEITGDNTDVQSEKKDETFVSAQAEELDLDELDVSSNNNSKKKRQLLEILFGEPDEDDILSEEELAELESKKAEKRQKKEAAKKAKEEKAQAVKEEKAAKSSQKKKANQEKKTLKAQKRARLRAEELANAESEKKLNKPIVIFIFTIFLGGVFLLYMGMNNFNYTQAIERASNYFANQKYRKAYDEIVGVEVKEKDEDLKNRIYTVMYVERLYESYLNNVELDRQEKALDSLLRGVTKYYEHYEEAVELGVVSDMDYSFEQIRTVLNEQYGISLEHALEINALENYDYVQYIQSVVEKQSAGLTIQINSGDTDLPEKREEEVEE